jgi:hypothetical protein
MKRNLAFLAMLSLIATSCALHTGNISSGYASFDQPYKVVGSAMGGATARYFLGFGGLDHSMLIEEAKSDLYTKTDLPQGAILTNFTVNVKNSFYFIYS